MTTISPVELRSRKQSAIPHAAERTVAPPPWLPLTFFAAAATALAMFGLAMAALARRIIDMPTDPLVTAAVHTCMLAFLTVGVLAALHQFTPVITSTPLRSVRLAGISMTMLVVGCWLLVSGFAVGVELLVATGGTVTTAAMLAIAWNLAGPLSKRAQGAPIWGVRMAVVYLLLTASFGVVYAFNRQAGWFPQLPTRVLAHAHLGLLGWLGLCYVAVAEKLWPMFFMAQRRSEGDGNVAVFGLSAGVALFTPGLLVGSRFVATVGAACILVGLAAHLTSAWKWTTNAITGPTSLHAFIAGSSLLLVVALLAGGVAGTASIEPTLRQRLVSAEILALAGWLAIAVVGHAHRIVPVTLQRSLFLRGLHIGSTGTPITNEALVSARLTTVACVTLTVGWLVAFMGTVTAVRLCVAGGGVLIAASALITMANLATGPRRAGISLQRATARRPAV